MMSLVLLALVLLGVAGVVAGAVMPGRKALAVAGETLLVFVAALIVWLMLLGLGVLGLVDVSSWLARFPVARFGVLVLAPPLLPAAAFLLYFVFGARRG